jgi:hypothetical protein
MSPATLAVKALDRFKEIAEAPEHRAAQGGIA